MIVLTVLSPLFLTTHFNIATSSTTVDTFRGKISSKKGFPLSLFIPAMKWKRERERKRLLVNLPPYILLYEEAFKEHFSVAAKAQFLQLAKSFLCSLAAAAAGFLRSELQRRSH